MKRAVYARHVDTRMGYSVKNRAAYVPVNVYQEYSSK